MRRGAASSRAESGRNRRSGAKKKYAVSGWEDGKPQRRYAMPDIYSEGDDDEAAKSESVEARRVP